MKRNALLLLLTLSSVLMHASADYEDLDSIMSVVETQNGEERVRSMMTLSRSFMSLSAEEGLAWGDNAVSEAHALGNMALEADALEALGRRYRSAYELDLAMSCFSRADSLRSILDDRDGMIGVRMLMGVVQQKMGLMEASLYHYERALELCQSSEFEMDKAYILNNMAVICYQQGSLDRALDLLYQARQSYEMLGDSTEILQCDNNIALLFFYMGRTDEASSIFTRILPYLTAASDNAALAAVHRNMGLIRKTNPSEYDEALRYFQMSIDYCVAISDSATIAENLVEIGEIYAFRKDYNSALQMQTTALATARRLKHLNAELLALCALGKTYYYLDDYVHSVDCFEQCISIEELHGLEYVSHTIYAYHLMALMKMGSYEAAEHRILALAEEMRGVRNELSKAQTSMTHCEYNAEQLIETLDILETELHRQEKRANNFSLAFYLLCLVLSVVVICNLIRISRRH